MILLDESKYWKVKKPLEGVTINNLFARSVIEQKVNGSVYVDNEEEPKTFYVVHPYGMSLLVGETENNEFNSKFIDYALNTFKIREKYEWLQVFPETWNVKFSILLETNLIKSKDNISNVEKNKIEENMRVNFKFNVDKYMDYRQKKINGNYEILRTDKEMYENIQGSVVPKYFWKDSEFFINNGVGYALKYEGKLISTAFSSFIHANQLEVGMETLADYRGKGFAQNTCASLIDYCLENNYEPVWACRLENEGSYKLAQKIGFEPTVYFPYCRLND